MPRDLAEIPLQARTLRSKSELALEMVRAARARGMRFAWVGVDGGYGKEPAFLRALDDAGEVFVADVHTTQRVWLEPPGLHVPAPKSARGRPPSRRQPTTDDMTVAQLAAKFRGADWTRCILRDSTRGPLTVDIAHRRVWVWDAAEAAARCWHLVVRREVGATSKIKYSLSNAPAETPPQSLAEMQGQRYWVERVFEDAKGCQATSETQPGATPKTQPPRQAEGPLGLPHRLHTLLPSEAGSGAAGALRGVCLQTMPFVRRRAASARRYVGAPFAPTPPARCGAQGVANAPRACLRGGSGATRRPARPSRAGRAWRAPTICRA